MPCMCPMCVSAIFCSVSQCCPLADATHTHMCAPTHAPTHYMLVSRLTLHACVHTHTHVHRYTQHVDFEDPRCDVRYRGGWWWNASRRGDSEWGTEWGTLREMRALISTTLGSVRASEAAANKHSLHVAHRRLSWIPGS